MFKSISILTSGNFHLHAKSSSSLIFVYIMNLLFETLEPLTITFGWSFYPWLIEFGSIHITMIGYIQVGERKGGWLRVWERKIKIRKKKEKKTKNPCKRKINFVLMSCVKRSNNCPMKKRWMNVVNTWEFKKWSLSFV